MKSLCYSFSNGAMSVSLVYHAGALGDFITALPAMAAWRRVRAPGRLILLGRPAFAPLAPAGLIDECWDAQSARWAPLFGAGLEPQDPRAHPLAQVGSALPFCPPASPLASGLRRLGVRLVARQDPLPASRIPIVDHHLLVFRDLALDESERTPRVASGGAARSAGRAAALHPGSGSVKKNWPLERFRALARLLEARGFDVTWITGPAEQDLELPPGCSALRGASLPDLASCLAGCRLYVGNDSGVTHLAAAAGCPTVALFGSASDEVVWAPRGRIVSVIMAPNGALHEIDEGAVFRECCLLGVR